MKTYNVDTSWYVDSGATANITADLEKLSTRDKYNGMEQIHTASGAGMSIKHIGQSTVHTLNRDLHLKNILQVPSTKKYLISIHKFTSDNDVFLEFHPDCFFYKGLGHEEHSS